MPALWLAIKMAGGARVSFGEQGGQSAADNLLTREEARQIAVNVGKLPGLAWR